MSTRPALTLVPLTPRRAAVARGEERWCRLPYDATAPDGPLACEWHTAASYGGTAAEWATASTWDMLTARVLLPLLAALSPGRPARAPVTADGRLVARALAASGLRTMAALADAVGTTPAQLSRCNRVPPAGAPPSQYRLPAATVAKLEDLVSAGNHEGSAIVKKDT